MLKRSNFSHQLIIICCVVITFAAGLVEADGSGATIDDSPCGLYLAASKYSGGLGLFAGRNFEIGEALGQPELLIPIADSNVKGRSLWKKFVWDEKDYASKTLAISAANHSLDVMIPGIGTHIQCSDKFANVDANVSEFEDAMGVHRNHHPTAGSFSYNQGFLLVATTRVKLGQEVLLRCKGSSKTDQLWRSSPRRSKAWIGQHGLCVDNLIPKQSTIPYAGQGAFSRRSFNAGSVVSYAPVIPIDSHEMNVVEQFFADGGLFSMNNPVRIFNNSRLLGRQMLVNYCFGNPSSDVLLFAYGPSVNFINHHRRHANVFIRWSSTSYQNEEYLNKSKHDLLESKRGLMIEYVASRDIEEGDEVFLNYGSEWEDAWKKYQSTWGSKVLEDDVYISASEYNRRQKQATSHTVPSNTLESSLPFNIETACYMQQVKSVFKMNSELRNENDSIDIEWSGRNDCLFPCVLGQRDQSNSSKVVYRAQLRPIAIGMNPKHPCFLRQQVDIYVNQIPETHVIFVDKPYTTDLHLPNAFRQPVGVPKDFYPSEWMRKSLNEDFENSALGQNELAQVKWKDSREAVDRNAYRVGLPQNVSACLLEYAEKIGVLDVFRFLLIEGNSLEPGEKAFQPFNGNLWYIHRPNSRWHSNMHWISPAEGEAHLEFLRVLSKGGFDSVLESFGRYLELDGLVAYHLTFIGVSFCSQGFMHHDFSEPDENAFNIIIPLIIANHSNPELYLQNKEKKRGNYRYTMNEGIAVGGKTKHATASCDYRHAGEMRFFATVYVADINKANVDLIVDDYTQIYPPKDPQFLLAQAGSHWRSDGGVQLPQPYLVNDDTLAIDDGAIKQVKWEGREVFDDVYEIPIPEMLLDDLFATVEESRILRYLRKATKKKKSGYTDVLDFIKAINEWSIERHVNDDSRIVLQLYVQDGSAVESRLLSVLETLVSILGARLSIPDLMVSNITLIGVSKLKHGASLVLNEETRKNYSSSKRYKVLIPILFLEDAGPELDLRIEDSTGNSPSTNLYGYKFHPGRAMIIGDLPIASIMRMDYAAFDKLLLFATFELDQIDSCRQAEAVTGTC